MQQPPVDHLDHPDHLDDLGHLDRRATMTLDEQPSVLRVYHSAVVTRWRERDRWLRRLGARVTTVSPRRWNEGGRVVDVVADPDEPLVVARTVGTHPYRFVSNPLPIWRTLRRGSFDIIDIHEEPASLAAAEVQLLAWLSGQGDVPFCLYSAQNLPKRYPIPFRWFERVALRRAAAVHSCNDAVTQILRDKGFAGPVVNLGLGVDPAPTASRAERTEDFAVGYVGRLEEYKGVHVLLDAIARVDGVSLAIVGDGPYRPVLESLVDALAIGDRVTFLGFAGPDAVQSRYADFDLVVVPSVERPNWIEQFGRVPVEAMSAGVPVVVSDSGSLPEVVADAGVLVPPEDPSALAEAIASLRDDPDRLAALGEAGRLRSAHYDWQAIAERQLALYRTMAASHPGHDQQPGADAAPSRRTITGMRTTGELAHLGHKLHDLRRDLGSTQFRKERIDVVAKRLGLRVEPRYHQLDAHRSTLLKTHHVEIVIDVGANIGQYALGLRAAGYEGWIESFEANPAVLPDLEAAAAGDPRWTIHAVALGPEATTANFFVTADSPSSSLLGPVDDSPEFMAGSWSAEVPVRTLDSFAFWERGRSMFLKLDIQGYELEALKGSTTTLASAVGVESELSLVALYADQALMEDITAFLREQGFDPRTFVRGYTDPTTHTVVQMDGIYERRDA